MKKLLVFFIFAIMCSCLFNQTAVFVFASEKQLINISELDLGSNENNSLLRKQINELNQQAQVNMIYKIMGMGFSLEEAVNYVFPNLKNSFENLEDKYNVLPQNASVCAQRNNCKIDYILDKNGKSIKKTAFYSDFFNFLQKSDNIKIQFETVYPEIKISDIKKQYFLVSDFSTDFASSSFERKNNIITACEAINGKLIKKGEVFSFNKETGLRTVDNGYMESKIISGGDYVSGVGGGVCQVSTTLYNACLLAELEIVEVHNHSLPTNYVKPCFDAMVNMGSADLKIRNNSKIDYLITCSTVGDKCRICIYGKPCEYKVKTRFEKYQEIEAKTNRIVNDGKYDYLGKGEHVIVQPINGYKARGYLDYYKDDVLIKSEKIRDNTYSSRDCVIVGV